MSDSFYKILGVSESASADEIKKAYRKLAKQYHPDKNKGDAKAEAKFKEVSEAYDILGDVTKRVQYDQVRKSGFDFGGTRPGGTGGGAGWPGGAGRTGTGGGSEGFSFEGGGAGFESIFENLFGGGARRGSSGSTGRSGRAGASSGTRGSGFGHDTQPERGHGISAQLSIPFELAARGGNQTFTFSRAATCGHCHGTGAEPGTGFRTCFECDGQGAITQGQGGFGMQRVCPRCHGQGQIPDEPCKVCRGTGEATAQRRLTVKIPPGIEHGQTIKLRGEGEQATGGNGDLLLQVSIEAHPQLRREGVRIVTDFEVDLKTAVLGGEVSVPALDGPVRLKVPPGTQSGTVFRLKAKGLYKRNGERGDAHVVVKVVIPSKLTEEQANEFRAWTEKL